MEGDNNFQSIWSNNSSSACCDEQDQFMFRFQDEIYESLSAQEDIKINVEKVISVAETMDTNPTSKQPTLTALLQCTSEDQEKLLESHANNLDVLRMLADQSEPENAFPTKVGEIILETVDEDQSEYQEDAQAKSKKEILKEKRDRKKVQILERKAAPAETLIFQLPSQAKLPQETKESTKQDLTKEEKAERQRIKNRESAQLSRDRKRHQESLLQSDLQLMTEEVKSLQAIVASQAICSHCGFNNLLKKQDDQTTSGGVPATSSCCNIHKQEDTSSATAAAAAAKEPVFFFDFSRQMNNGVSNTSSNSQTGAPFTIGKGPCSTFIVLFIIAMIVLSGSQQENNNNNLNRESAFMHLSMSSSSHPYHMIFEQCKGLTQDQLLECLLIQIQELNYNERLALISQLNLDTQLALQPIVNLEAATSTVAELFCTEKPIQESFLDFCQKFNSEQVENDRKYYADLQRQLDVLQQEKLAQLESLKEMFCPPISEENPVVCSQSLIEEGINHFQAANKNSRMQQQLNNSRVQNNSKYSTHSDNSNKRHLTQKLYRHDQMMNQGDEIDSFDEDYSLSEGYQDNNDSITSVNQMNSLHPKHLKQGASPPVAGSLYDRLSNLQRKTEIELKEDENPFELKQDDQHSTSRQSGINYYQYIMQGSQTSPPIQTIQVQIQQQQQQQQRHPLLQTTNTSFTHQAVTKMNPQYVPSQMEMRQPQAQEQYYGHHHHYQHQQSHQAMPTHVGNMMPRFAY